ncbi:MAG: hypothetical protein FWD71_18780 [Oscillospiraceae bacterium]|nr:hypothetical protein [Oscillospiraceae bacterium]
MNTHEVEVKVRSAMYKLIHEKGVASPVEVLMEIGALSKENYEAWRLGKAPYLERVCTINLHKLSTVNHEIRVYAQKHNLKGSWTMYKKWKSKGKVIPLRFSRYGVESIERSYAMHYISSNKIAEAKEHKEFHKEKDALAGTIAPCGLVCGLCGEYEKCGGCEAGKCDRTGICYQRNPL